MTGMCATKKAVKRKVNRTAKKKAAKTAKKRASKKSGAPRRRIPPAVRAAVDSTTDDSVRTTRASKKKRPSSDQKMLPNMADARNAKLDAEIETWQKKTVSKNNAGAAIKSSLVKIGKGLRDDGLTSYSHNGDKFTLIPGEDTVKHQTVKNE